MKPGKRVKVIKGYYKGQFGIVMVRGLFGWGFYLNLEELSPGYAISQWFWIWQLEKKLKQKGNVIQAKERFRG